MYPYNQTLHSSNKETLMPSTVFQTHKELETAQLVWCLPSMHAWGPELDPHISQLIKAQRLILGFNLTVRNAKQPATATSTSVRNDNPASKNLRMRLCLRAVSSCFIILSRAGIKGMHCLASMAAGIKGVCYCLVSKADQWGCFTL